MTRLSADSLTSAAHAAQQSLPTQKRILTRGRGNGANQAQAGDKDSDNSASTTLTSNSNEKAVAVVITNTTVVEETIDIVSLDIPAESTDLEQATSENEQDESENEQFEEEDEQVEVEDEQVEVGDENAEAGDENAEAGDENAEARDENAEAENEQAESQETKPAPESLNFAEDSDMDTDDLLEKEVKTKKKPGPKPKAKIVLPDGLDFDDPRVKAPRKTSKKYKKKSAFSDDEEQLNGYSAPPLETAFNKNKRGAKARTPFVKPENPLDFDPKYTFSLSRQYPDNYWRHHAESRSGMINRINEDHPLQLVESNIHDQAPITGMILSPDGTMLVTFCNLGSARIWSLEDYSLLKTLRDAKESQIDEYYVGTFVPDQTMLLVGGKLKDRKNWSEADEDNSILPCPLKLFDILTGEVVTQLEGHTEELLCVKRVQFRGENYFLSGSQDGYLNKWHMDSDWKTLKSMVQMADGVTCMAFSVSFVPNTGNKYFLAAADENIRLYDFEGASLLQTFENMYSSYCDCGKFITAVDFPMAPLIPEEYLNGDISFSNAEGAGASEGSSSDPSSAAASASSSKKGKMRAIEEPELALPGPKPQQFAYFISRGVELLDSEERMIGMSIGVDQVVLVDRISPNTLTEAIYYFLSIPDQIAKDYNSCTLHKLIYPDTKGGKWYLSEVKRYQDDEYFSNAWLMKIATNGRYLLAPTCTGEVFIYNLKSGQVTGVLKDHDDVEIRDVLFHPTRPLLFTSADDGLVRVYSYQNQEDIDEALKDSRETERKESEAAALISMATELSAVSVKDDDEVDRKKVKKEQVDSDLDMNGNDEDIDVEMDGDLDETDDEEIDDVDDDLTE